MQGFLSRVARLPSSSCRCKTCLRTYVNGVAARPSAASGRGLRAANAVTALYGSIFAGAALADALAKRKRRQEWDDKITAVQEEIDELMDEERRLLEALSARKSRQFSAAGIHSRSYRAGSPSGLVETKNAQSLANRAFSTKVLAQENSTEDHTNQTDRSSVVQEVDIDEVAPAGNLPLSETNQDQYIGERVDKINNETFEDGFSTMRESLPRPEPDFIWERSSIVRIKAIQKLAVQQLSYRFLLRPSIAHDYAGLPVEYRLDTPTGAHPSVLLGRLRGIRQRLYSLKYIRDSEYDDLMTNMNLESLDMMRSHRERSTFFLRQDLDRYTKGAISMEKLLVFIAENLSSCEEPDRPEAFALLINFFTPRRQNDLSDMIVKCVVQHMFTLTPPLIIAIITHFRKTKNLKDFDLFLQMLRGEGGYAMDHKVTWKKKKVNGITLTVPPVGTFSPLLITSVIAATLRFDQPEKAEAYMQIARAHGFSDNLATLSAFLRFYGIRNDFESGAATLIRALNFMVSSSELEEKRVSRLVLSMADFSDRCGRDHLTLTLLQAAVHSGFDFALAHVSEDSDPETEHLIGTLLKWRKQQRKFATEFSQRRDLPLHEKCARFADLTAGEIMRLQHPASQHDNDITPSTISAESPNEGHNAEVIRFVKSRSDSNPKIESPALKPTTGCPPEASIKIRKLRAQLEYLHSRIDSLSSSDKRNVSREDR